jgi:hypothetical protein
MADRKQGHGFHETKQGMRYTILLDRLLRLNHERYAEEVAQGLHEKGAKGKAAKKGKASNGKGDGNTKGGADDGGVEQKALF